ncbi:hypothetical protein COJ10_24195 [Bacillus thuringiensis]|nr:hypothetical protein COJ10_24195 [Bacillus thuringiensis]
MLFVGSSSKVVSDKTNKFFPSVNVSKMGIILFHKGDIIVFSVACPRKKIVFVILETAPYM